MRKKLDLVVLLSCFVFVVCYLSREYLQLVLTPKDPFDWREYCNTHPVVITEQQKDWMKKNLPKWLTEYIEWHHEQRQHFLLRHSNNNNNNNNNTKVLVVSIKGRHGGLSDRLRSLPFFVWEAARTNRLLFMEWDNPCAMQEFLIPSTFDWTVPPPPPPPEDQHDYDILMDTDNDSQFVFYNYDEERMSLAENDKFTQEPWIKTKHSGFTYHRGMKRLLSQELNVSFLTDPIFSNIYKTLFQLSPPLKLELDQTMKRLGLTPGQYNAIHLRARYPGISPAFQRKWFMRNTDADGIQWTSDAAKEIRTIVSQAVDCLNHNTTISTSISGSSSSSISNTNATTIYFASDTNRAVQYVTKSFSSSSSRPFRKQQQQQVITGMVTPYERLHLNRQETVRGLFFGRTQKTPPLAFYPTFVDMWILSQAQCLCVGVGGYGLFAAMLGGNNCISFYAKNNFAVSSSNNWSASYCPNVDLED